MKYSLRAFFVIMMLILMHEAASAQNLSDAFEEPNIVKVENRDLATYEAKFSRYSLTGAGFQGNTTVDNLPTTEIRARLQHVFGDPTKRLDDFIGKSDVRPANSIQFEYWFMVNDSIPMIILDIDGPFSHGLVYAGAVDFIDLMPEIKRTLSRKLMAAPRMGDYQDVFYSPERNEWFEVAYRNGRYISDPIPRPARFNNLRLN